MGCSIMSTPVRPKSCKPISLYVAKAYSGPQMDRSGFQYIFSGDLLLYLFGGLYTLGILVNL